MDSWVDVRTSNRLASTSRTDRTKLETEADSVNRSRVIVVRLNKT